MLEKGRAIVMGSMAAGSVRCYAAMVAAQKVYVDLVFRLFYSAAVWYLKRLKQINVLLVKLYPIKK